MDGSVGLYLSFNPKDAADAVLTRLIVATTNASMESFALAAQCAQSDRARELQLRIGFKGTETVNKLIEMLDRRRGQSPQNVLVGTVNNVTVGEVTVEKGGQAIVGVTEVPPKKAMTVELAPPVRVGPSDEEPD
jgi:hypothetical protein